MMSCGEAARRAPAPPRPNLVEQRLRLAEAAHDQLGRPTGRAPFAATVATTISTPSSDRCRRSRKATSRTSPTPSPSTNVTPVSHAIHDPRPVLVQLDDRPVLGEHDRARRNARVASQLRVRREHPELAVHRHHRLRPDERRSPSGSPPRCRARTRGRARSPGGAPPLRAFASRLIVSCTRSSFPGTGFAERITVSPRSTLTDGWSLYAIRVSADIGSPWLPVQRTIASCGASSLELGRADERVVRRLEVAEVARDVQVLPHRAPDDADLAPGLDGHVDGLLHPVHVRGEARDEHAPLRARG